MRLVPRGASQDGHPSNRGQRLAKARHAVAVLPLAAGLKDCDALKPLENVALGAGGSGRRTKTAMLRHKLRMNHAPVRCDKGPCWYQIHGFQQRGFSTDLPPRAGAHPPKTSTPELCCSKPWIEGSPWCRPKPEGRCSISQPDPVPSPPTDDCCHERSVPPNPRWCTMH